MSLWKSCILNFQVHGRHEQFSGHNTSFPPSHTVERPFILFWFLVEKAWSGSLQDVFKGTVQDQIYQIKSQSTLIVSEARNYAAFLKHFGFLVVYMYRTKDFKCLWLGFSNIRLKVDQTYEYWPSLDVFWDSYCCSVSNRLRVFR